MDNNSDAGAPGPEFQRLVGDLRAISAEKQQRREQGAAIVQKAQKLMEAGAITPADLARIHALHLRLEGGR